MRNLHDLLNINTTKNHFNLIINYLVIITLNIYRNYYIYSAHHNSILIKMMEPDMI